MNKKQHVHSATIKKLKREINTIAITLKVLKRSFRAHQEQENKLDAAERGRATCYTARQIQNYTTKLHRLIAMRTIIDPYYDGRKQLKHKKVTDIYSEVYNYWLDMEGGK